MSLSDQILAQTLPQCKCYLLHMYPSASVICVCMYGKKYPSTGPPVHVLHIACVPVHVLYDTCVPQCKCYILHMYPGASVIYVCMYGKKYPRTGPTVHVLHIARVSQCMCYMMHVYSSACTMYVCIYDKKYPSTGPPVHVMYNACVPQYMCNVC